MTIEFPRWVFRCPGTLRCQGGTYSQAIAMDVDAAAEFLADGWYPSLQEAMDASREAPATPPVPHVVEAPVPDDLLPPTRLEIEAKMASMGMKIDRRKATATLLDELNAALKKATRP